MNISISTSAPAFTENSIEARVDAYDWPSLARELDGFGCVVLPKLLAPDECAAVSGLYSEERHFRSHIIMARHGFGRGEYRYFNYPLPGLLGGRRIVKKNNLAGIANRWNERRGSPNAIPMSMPPS